VRVGDGCIETYLLFNEDYAEMGFLSGIGCVIVEGVLVLRRGEICRGESFGF
jgi:hypothetical protein